MGLAPALWTRDRGAQYFNIPQGSADFCLLSDRVAEIFRSEIREQNPFLRGLLFWIGFNIAYLPFVCQARQHGQTKYGLRRLVSFAVNGGEPKRLWLDLGDLGLLVRAGGAHPRWQDHGLGLLRTILDANGVSTDLASTRACTSWDEVREQLRGYDMLLMNVRSYTFTIACEAAQIFKALNPGGLVVTGGIHATVALHEMPRVEHFDKICRGPGEHVIVDLVRDPHAFPRVIAGSGAESMGEWPRIDRTLWPRPASPELEKIYPWPLEPECGWGPAPVATILTSRVCPWQCAFCNQNSYMPSMGRRPVDAVIDELNDMDARHGPIGSVVIHDSVFFQNPHWVKEWIDAYPRKANRPWPYWTAARAGTVRQWPDLFEALVRDTNWTTVSIGFESGSDRVLKLLNKERTEEDNAFAIDLLNRIGDDLERQGKPAPVFWANIMLAIPEMAEIIEDNEDTYTKVSQRRLQDYIDLLG